MAKATLSNEQVHWVVMSLQEAADLRVDDARKMSKDGGVSFARVAASLAKYADDLYTLANLIEGSHTVEVSS